MTLPDPIALKAALNQNCQLFVGEDKTIEVDTTGYDLAGAQDRVVDGEVALFAGER